MTAFSHGLVEGVSSLFKLFIFFDALAKSRTEPQMQMAVFQGRQTIHRSEFVDSERNMTVSFPPDRSTLTFCEGIFFILLEFC
ncbi:MAG: hypothetical protein RBT64_12345 [Trichloromonas sp.]|jgi:hypothetical protein|nr:hypothetical protein [Trichloromonas sp.]